MKKKILFLFNPYSGKGKIKENLADIVDIMVKAGYEVTVYTTQCQGDAVHKAREEAGNYDRIVCSGGDGTLDEVVTGVMSADQRVPVGYIPAGSTNDFAKSLHVSKNMMQAAVDIVEGEPHAFDVGKFNDDFFVYIAAFGLFTDVSYETNQDLKNILGHAAYILEGTQRLFNIQSYKLQVETAEQNMEGDFIFGMISNATSVGGFRKLTGPDVMLDDGLFEVLLVHRPKNILELNEIIAALVGNAECSHIESFKTSKLKIICEEEVSWTLDGEFGGEHKEVQIENLNHAVRIMLKKDETVPLINAADL